MCSTPFGDEHLSPSESDGAIPKANLHFTIKHQEDFVCGFVVESNHDLASCDSMHETFPGRFVPNKYGISVRHCKLRNRNDDRPVLRNYSTDQLWPIGASSGMAAIAGGCADKTVTGGWSHATG
jgi:hypothetical protein